MLAKSLIDIFHITPAHVPAGIDGNKTKAESKPLPLDREALRDLFESPTRGALVNEISTNPERFAELDIRTREKIFKIACIRSCLGEKYDSPKVEDLQTKLGLQDFEFPRLDPDRRDPFGDRS